MRQKREHSNLIKEHLKKRGITQTWLAKELGMSFSITNAYVCNRNLILMILFERIYIK
ncbi:hypothetical protein HMPREF0650_0399 [Hoylesella buccalis ATCC 35310]|uniref:HTH cro/C1-type domain-containing protein n=1 Tax=Hoylesella buccalis ATCC 35310 TaxID=679190 RepID=D1W748_9BACT|nr:hypothetical protein [Hoylesella buccalis]EFA91596.1 hypothetical protein HMPREF0650_0399 [Hoylesella buccalis ATCC 35310]